MNRLADMQIGDLLTVIGGKQLQKLLDLLHVHSLSEAFKAPEK
jgi:hypothetical protein